MCLSPTHPTLIAVNLVPDHDRVQLDVRQTSARRNRAGPSSHKPQATSHNENPRGPPAHQVQQVLVPDSLYRCHSESPLCLHPCLCLGWLSTRRLADS